MVAWQAFLAGMALSAVVVALLLFRRERDIRMLAVNQSRRVLKGQAAEQIAPMLPEFAFLPSDARFLGHPVDYVVFDGLSEGDDVEIVLVEVKSGNARMNDNERRIRDAVDAGRVRFEVVRVDVG